MPELAGRAREHLRPAPEVLTNPKAFYDELVEIDLDALEAHVVGPHSPDRGRPISKLAAEVRANGWPARITNALIGSRPNFPHEDTRPPAPLPLQGIKAGLPAEGTSSVTHGAPT